MKKVLSRVTALVLVIFLVCFLLSLIRLSPVEAWAGFPGIANLHGEMTRDALEGLGWTNEEIGEIPEYADDVDIVSPHCSRSNHRVTDYQKIFQDAGGKRCNLPGAERWAATHIRLAKQYYNAGNKEEGDRHLGYAIHYIQDALCPPHVFPFKEGAVSPHTDFETYTALFYGLRDWPSLVGMQIQLPFLAPKTCVNKS